MILDKVPAYYTRTCFDAPPPLVLQYGPFHPPVDLAGRVGVVAAVVVVDLAAEELDGGPESVCEGHPRLPAQHPLGQGDVGPPPARVVLHRGQVDDLAVAAHLLQDDLGKVPDALLDRVAKVDGAGDGRQRERLGRRSISSRGRGSATQTDTWRLMHSTLPTTT